MKPRAAQACPVCGAGLIVERMACESCDTRVEGRFRLPRLARLSRESQRLVELLVLNSGSLKGVARAIGVSYPTVRKRIDALIAELGDQVEADRAREEALLEEVGAGRRTPGQAAAEIEED